MSKQLDQLRDEFDKIDTEIMILLNKRMEIAADIAKVKNVLGLPSTDEKREREIFCRLRQQASHSVLRDAVEEIFRPIFKCSKKV